MEIGTVFYPRDRSEWREWLSYDELVEEAICFGWIDGLVKKYCPDSRVQRITPRRKKSFLSELNRQRIWKLEEQGKMTQAGFDAVAGKIGSIHDPFVIPDWVLEQLQLDPIVWENFQAFSLYYKRLKIGWISNLSPKRRDVAQSRLDYLIKMTAQNKQYGSNPFG